MMEGGEAAEPSEEEAAMHAPEGINAEGPAPEARFEDGQGAPVMLSGLWARGPLALVFLRHLG
ncbi:MAG: hypothetical protein A3J27_07420 [Candidatus Tectomicrobia bacterium RIFCSPLOWO2_12_FULL_69_37]|nr:MAG: hypothetical protein A3I72_10230 [Candidatus Tectomicrobia bacterium RIFCSPLOWO2_02_FULL_70_19]OGL64279.1 MAG: hypothetical protein A3J27_07420 [Candidatus Tectomicrobia bacterium RIFCSPLOWO2_12_FULL_69_37]